MRKASHIAGPTVTSSERTRNVKIVPRMKIILTITAMATSYRLQGHKPHIGPGGFITI